MYNQEKMGIPKPDQEINKEIEEERSEYEKNKHWETKVDKNRGETIFRDGKGHIYEIKNIAEISGWNDEEKCSEFLVGGFGNESPNIEFELKVWRESEDWDDDLDSDSEGDNLCGYGGLYFPVKNWKEKLENEFPEKSGSKAKEAITRAILKKIDHLKGSEGANYSPKTIKDIEEGVS